MMVRMIGGRAWAGWSAQLAAMGSLMATLSAAPLSTQEIPLDSVTTVFVSDTIPGFGAVGGVAVDALGFVYVADFRNAVWRLSPDGEVERFADGLYGASGNAIGPRGYLYQSSFNGNFVSRISRTGEVETWVDEGLSGPVGIAASPEGELFVVSCTGGYVSRIGPDRSVTELARSDLMACPNGITFDDRGDLYVVSFNNTKVLRVTLDGAVTEFADIPGAGGNGHITFARGAFYVTKFRGNQVFRVQRDGTFAPLAGTGAAGEADGPALQATFTRPNGIGASPSGDVLWVNDLTEGQGLGQGVSLVSMRRIRMVSLADALTAVDPAEGVAGLRAAHAAYHEARPGEDSSAGAVALAYQWMTAGRVGHGMALMELNASTFSSDPNAQFHLGEAFRYAGQNERAAEQYRRVLELDPEHANAAARLSEVTGR
jgi:sugar lactone lactonase YvrE